MCEQVREAEIKNLPNVLLCLKVFSEGILRQSEAAGRRRSREAAAVSKHE